MHLLRRLTLVDYALFVALIVVGTLAVANQKVAGSPGSTGDGYALTSQNIATYQGAIEDLFNALAVGQAFDSSFAAVAAAVRAAGDTALAPAIDELGAAYAMRNDGGISTALRTINGLLTTSPFAETFLTAYAGGTLNYALNAGPATPSTGREWVHLVWVETAANDAFVGWQVVTGEATWTVEPGNAAVLLSLSVPGEGYAGTLRLAPASPGALIEAAATFSATLAESIVALGEPVPPNDAILIMDLGEGRTPVAGQPWVGETRLGEPPSLVDDLRRAEAIAWTGTVPDGRTFVMRIKTGETGRAAVSAVFPG